jgi:SAM-dependent methyltransferase
VIHPAIDALTSPTLKHIREHWWDDEFTEFLAETLRPRPGNRILDVGCGQGSGEVAIGRLHVSQLQLAGVDLVLDNAIAARHETQSHNQRAGFAAADACHLPFRGGVFDSTYCVAVLQHIRDVDSALAEFARVTAPHGRVVVVEPDNAARYWYSSVSSGREVFVAATRFFDALAGSRAVRTESKIGPRVPTLLAAHGIDPLDVRLFPVSQIQLGPPPATLWDERRTRLEQVMSGAGAEGRDLGAELLRLLTRYQSEAEQADASFVEIQITMLFATVGQKREAD